jgi:hypothetical protein
MLLLMKYSSRTSRTLISLANGTSRTLMNPPFVNGRYIDQWETPIDEWLVLAYGRDQIRKGIDDERCIHETRYSQLPLYPATTSRVNYP